MNIISSYTRNDNIKLFKILSRNIFFGKHHNGVAHLLQCIRHLITGACNVTSKCTRSFHIQFYDLSLVIIIIKNIRYMIVTYFMQ